MQCHLQHSKIVYSDEQMLREGRGLEKVEVEDTSLEGVEVGLSLIGQDSSPTDDELFHVDRRESTHKRRLR